MAKRIRRPKLIIEVHPDKKKEVIEAAKLHNRTLSDFCRTCIEYKLREIREGKK